MASRKCKVRQRRMQIKKLQEGQLKLEPFSDNTNQTVKSSIAPMAKTPALKNHHKETLFSEAARVILSLLFIVFGVLLANEILLNWSAYWNASTKGIGAIILLADSIGCIVLGVSLWWEKDRNYIMSIYSALVAFASLVVTMVK